MKTRIMIGIKQKLGRTRMASTDDLDTNIENIIIAKFIQTYGNARLKRDNSNRYKKPWFISSYIADRIIQHQQGTDGELQLSFSELLGHAMGNNQTTAYFRDTIQSLLVEENKTLDDTQKLALTQYVRTLAQTFNQIGVKLDKGKKPAKIATPTITTPNNSRKTTKEAIVINAEKTKNIPALSNGVKNSIIDSFIHSYGHERLHLDDQGSFKKPMIISSYIAGRIIEHQSGAKEITFYELLGHATGLANSTHHLRQTIIALLSRNDERLTPEEKTELYEYIRGLSDIFEKIDINPNKYPQWARQHARKEEIKKEGKDKERIITISSLKEKIKQSGAIEEVNAIAMRIYEAGNKTAGFFGVCTIQKSLEHLDQAINSKEVKQKLYKQGIISSPNGRISSEIIEILKAGARKNVSGKGRGGVTIIEDENALSNAGEAYLEARFKKGWGSRN